MRYPELYEEHDHFIAKLRAFALSEKVSHALMHYVSPEAMLKKKKKKEFIQTAYKDKNHAEY